MICDTFSSCINKWLKQRTKSMSTKNTVNILHIIFPVSLVELLDIKRKLFQLVHFPMEIFQAIKKKKLCLLWLGVVAVTTILFGIVYFSSLSPITANNSPERQDCVSCDTRNQRLLAQIHIKHWTWIIFHHHFMPVNNSFTSTQNHVLLKSVFGMSFLVLTQTSHVHRHRLKIDQKKRRRWKTVEQVYAKTEMNLASA